MAQKSSRNGNTITTSGEYRILYVFAEVLNDPAYNSNYGSSWLPGEMPSYPERYLDTGFTDSSDIDGVITKRVFNGSFNEFKLTGDYLDTLIQVPYSATSGYGIGIVIDSINAIPGTDITTARGWSVKNDFDLWNEGQQGLPKTNAADNQIDFVAIIWRVNSKMSTDNNSGGVTGTGKSIKGEAIDHVMAITSFVGIEYNIFTHEFFHPVIGGNNFHENYGADPRKALSFTFSSGLLCSDPQSGTVVNAWDRQRLGWKPDAMNYYISALDNNGNETNTKYDTGTAYTEKTITLRDFDLYGDAVRIELPYLEPGKHRQYLWLENRQNLLGNASLNYLNKGLHAYFQIGKDDTSY